MALTVEVFTCLRCGDPMSGPNQICEKCTLLDGLKSATQSGNREAVIRAMMKVVEFMQWAGEMAIEALEGAKAEMDAKVLAERERCAKVADEEIAESEWRLHPESAGYRHACEQIAAKIRGGA